jgi:hypothetical protein
LHVLDLRTTGPGDLGFGTPRGPSGRVSNQTITSATPGLLRLPTMRREVQQANYGHLALSVNVNSARTRGLFVRYSRQRNPESRSAAGKVCRKDSVVSGKQGTELRADRDGVKGFRRRYTNLARCGVRQTISHSASALK